MTWHETTADDDDLTAFETVAHWLGADISSIAHALGALTPRCLTGSEAHLVREPKSSKRSPGEPVDLSVWDVVITDNLPVVLRHKPGLVEIWRCTVNWAGPVERYLQMVEEPIAIDPSEGRPEQQLKRVLKAIAVMRTKQARRSTVCTWCGKTMVKGERFSTYCCYGCASTVKGVVY